jgi:hypothetical protein
VKELHDEPELPLLPPPAYTLGGSFGSLMHPKPPPPPSNPFAEGILGMLARQQSPSGGLFGLGGALSSLLPPRRDRWVKIPIVEFVKKLKPSYLGPDLQHPDSTFRTFFPFEEYEATTKTPPILMTEDVFKEFARLNPQRRCIREGYWKRQPIRVPGDIRTVYGGTVHFNIS